MSWEGLQARCLPLGSPRRIGNKSIGAEAPPTTASFPVGGPSGPTPSARVAASHRKQKHRG
ncbi:DUF6053 domain-containing protein [Lysobacter yananisis]|uniref:DUF6053 domain-containing protein n=1 Tax=Lysobacter yananisis TaxID=1003114 RepID=UPI003CE4AE5B